VAAGSLVLARQPAAGAPDSAAQIEIVAKCDFEGPYSTGDQQIQDGCVNNWQWGRKDMVLKAERDAGRPGTVQSIHVRGITSGGMQFFYMKLKLKKDRYYRVSYWMKTDGLEGPVNVCIRKGGYPWTVHVRGPRGMRAQEWRQYSFSAKCNQDVNDDVGVMWETGSLGKIWLDDLVVEESEQPFETTETRLPPEPKPGNMLQRSSCEGRRDHLWSMPFFGWTRDGVWEGVEGDWEDPQMYRAEGGKVGKYCLAVPSATHAGQGTAHTIPFEVLPGKPYTVSLWLKSDPPGYPGSVALLYWWSGRHHAPVASLHPPLVTEWQRYSFTGIPQPPPGSTDTSSPVKVVLQIAPSAIKKGVIFADGIQLEAGDKATDYKPAYPLELYADVGQDGGNLIEWGQKVPLNLLAAAADQSSLKQAKVEVTITGYPGRVVWSKTLTLIVGEAQLLNLDLKRRGLFRVAMRTLNSEEAAPQEMLFAIVPEPRNTGEMGMFGTHIALRPFLVRYIQRLGFAWTRLHDCSRLSKWDATEPERGKYYWHDEVVEGVRKGGLRILGLPDNPPEWAKVSGEPGFNPVDVAAYGKYCEEIARHYAGKIDYWELWNEPYMDGSYSGGPKLFGELMQAGYRGFKRGNPDCKVLGWCADMTNPGWGAQIPEQARKCIDVFSFHNYIWNLAGGGSLPFVGELSDHRKQWPAGVTECWNTEGTNGDVCANSFYTFLPLSTPELNQRATAFASRVWVEHAKAGVSKYFVYQMHNTDSPMYYGGYQSLFISYDRTPTPAAVSTAVTAYCIDGLKPTRFRPVPGVVQGLFAGEDRATWAVYDDGGVVGRRTLDLAKLPTDAQMLDVMGNDPRQDGRWQWDVGQQPLFVISENLDARKLAAVARRAIQN